MTEQGQHSVSESPTGNAVPKGVASGARSSRRRAARRIFAVALILLFLVPLAAGGLLFFLFKGQAINSEAIDARVHAALSDVVGENYDVTIGSTELSLLSLSILSLTGNDVSIRQTVDGTSVAMLKEVKVGLSILSAIRGAPQFEKLIIEGGQIDLDALPKSDPTPSSPGLNDTLSEAGRAMSKLEDVFSDGTIRSIALSDIVLSSQSSMRSEPLSLNINSGAIGLDEGNQLALSVNAETAHSKLSLGAKWRTNSQGGKQLSLGIGGLDFREWFETADLVEENKRGLGLSGVTRIDLQIPYDAALNPLQPFAKAQTANTKLRFGRDANVDIHSAVLNFRIFPSEALIELEPSQIAAGEKILVLSGDLRPESEGIDLRAPLVFQLNVTSNQQSAPEHLINLSGVAYLERKQLSVEQILVESAGEKLAGYLGLQFSETSAGLTGSLSSTELSLPFIHSIWPFHVAPEVRVWIDKNLSRGKVQNLKIRFDVPPGRFAELKNRGGFGEDEIRITADFRDMDIRTPEALPPVIHASGSILFENNSLAATLDQAEMKADGFESVSIESSRFEIPDVFAKGLPAQLSTSLDGGLNNLTAIADSEPLAIAKNLGLKPKDLSGSAKVELKLKFDADQKTRTKPMKWAAKVSLTDAASASPIFGRKVSGANVAIEAVNTLVKVKGKVVLDGVSADLDIAEPINGGSPDKRKRNVELRLTDRELAKQGVDLAPIVKGTISVAIKSSRDAIGNYALDLTNADLSLPWVSWFKGTGIPATASFKLEQKGDRNTLSDFRFSGAGGLNAQGILVFDKAGLVSSNLTNVKLRGQDKFDVVIQRKGGRYEISVTGAVFEGRAIIDQVIHKSGFATEKSNTDVTLTANFGRLIGFEKQVMENALVRYQTDSGLLTKLEVRGALNGQLSAIDATRSGNSTVFTFDASDAGASLAMVNIYTKMQGGRLTAELIRNGDGPFNGNVKLKNFMVIGEERLRSLVAAPVSDQGLERAAGKIQEINTQRVKFDRAEATITKSDGYLGVKDGRIRNFQIGLTFDGVLFDQNNQMNVRGTFMPLFSISRLIGEIPILGDILGNGKNSGLIGITYRLRGAANNPQIAVNPISVIAPGIFRQIFEFQP